MIRLDFTHNTFRIMYKNYHIFGLSSVEINNLKVPIITKGKYICRLLN